jgi:hypothetical protein
VLLVLLVLLVLMSPLPACWGGGAGLAPGAILPVGVLHALSPCHSSRSCGAQLRWPKPLATTRT